MLRYVLLYTLLLLLSLKVSANVEKVIFLGPHQAAVSIAGYHESRFENIEILSEKLSSLRRKLHSAFPSSPATNEPREAWMLIENIEVGRRYEARLCWSAAVCLYSYRVIQSLIMATATDCFRLERPYVV